MRLSDAIIKGSKLRSEVFKDHYRGGGSGVIASGYEGEFGKNESRLASHLVNPGILNTWPSMQVYVRCPVCYDFLEKQFYVILHLADNHGWHREQIAFWIEWIEETVGWI